jgi:hypothetical protein
VGYLQKCATGRRKYQVAIGATSFSPMEQSWRLYAGFRTSSNHLVAKVDKYTVCLGCFHNIALKFERLHEIPSHGPVHGRAQEPTQISE